MGTIYILKSLVNGRYYIGSTIDLNRRLLEHSKGKTKSLRCIKPFELVFSQVFDSIREARKIEYKIKKFKSKVIIDKIVNDKVINLGP